ncbi:MAG TPA: hypothetical protein VMV95_04090 [Bacillota bacterium]|nr:hypothetical protein [Candidatus Paceibacterota bacterium]HUW44112.1 hypothetical protein [Bacillota bacterium]
MRRPINKKGNILTQNIIFIVLNLVFLLILVLFLVSKSGGAAVLEEKYAKQMALILDSVEPGMVISLNMEDAIKIANKENRDLDDVIDVQDNIVTVQLREKGGYSYSFFNDIDYGNDFSIYLNTSSRKEYIIFIEP